MTIKIHAIIFSTKDSWPTLAIARAYIYAKKYIKIVKDRVITKKYKFKDPKKDYIDRIYILKFKHEFENLDPMEAIEVNYRGELRKLWIIKGKIKNYYDKSFYKKIPCEWL